MLLSPSLTASSIAPYLPVSLATGLASPPALASHLVVLPPQQTGDWQQAWGAGCFAAFITGLMQLVTLPVLHFVVKVIPAEAMLSAVAGVSLAYISINFLFEIYAVRACGRACVRAAAPRGVN
jgi:hypothetical protein